MPDREQSSSSRRDFLHGATSGLLIVSPQVAFGPQAHSSVEFGLVGCGSRGSWIAQLFVEHTGARLVAAADVVRAKLDGLRDK